MTKIKEETKKENKEKLTDLYVIILYNDDVNTFDHVINCLMKYCNHKLEQAEQCALIVHNNGKCDVKSGTYEELQTPYYALIESKLSVKIEAK